MNNKEFLDKEREVLKLFPKDELGDIIERRWGELRSIIDEHEEWDSRQIMDALVKWYKSL